ncbi:CASP-like protein 4D1 [Alnus glutinosa]|uniref:CASP-like protein 4D1 n=1 Tax=Alnus glutinosa TaxID=3517 RepID=UPI002D792A1A|nr:CASP-like protein 4D1 [Alnus glutinosa]
MALSASKATLLLRVLSVAFQLASIILLITNKKTASNNNGKFGPKTLTTYRYMFGTNVIGGGYNLLQIVSFLIFRILMNNDDSYVYCLIEFYGDKAISYLLATGSAAGFGATRDLKKFLGEAYNIEHFFDMGYASAILLFLAFLCTAILSILSSYSFLKKVHLFVSHPNPN